MTSRPPRDLRTEVRAVIARQLTGLFGIGQADILAGNILVALDGHHIGLTDTRPPADPNADWHPPAPTSTATGPSDDYRAARQALKGQQQ